MVFSPTVSTQCVKTDIFDWSSSMRTQARVSKRWGRKEEREREILNRAPTKLQQYIPGIY